MLDMGQPASSASGLKFSHLAIGEDFGHLVDQNGNLHGWGNNRNGELGTSDSYPRQRLAQIRIFNNEKQYMRCHRVFNGHNFALGLFESNSSPKPVLIRCLYWVKSNNFCFSQLSINRDIHIIKGPPDWESRHR